jgi:hypothetical protein
MTEAEWLACDQPGEMLAHLEADAPLSTRKLRLYAVGVARRALALLTRDEERRALDVAERFADGLAGEADLRGALPDAEGYDWLGGVADVAYSAVSPPGALDAAGALRVTRIVASALGDAAFPDADFDHDAYLGAYSVRAAERAAHAALLRCAVGPLLFRPVAFDPAWLSWGGGTVARIAEEIYDARAFDRLPVLADALEDADCTDPDLLGHLRSPGPHVRGCWALDLVLGKE